ncbi:cell envelope-related function transcriptional attenuator common domain-containing protein [Nakamurella panacisegetis]|uniref:Cell envelope-related function transcriptional attenuator common domain-containing protein n=1 Tax=Nakamurella panacisegetis TaxID=1090615 RepID=A0A1H0TAE7_9ACTN|nr:LCP family protein [Nakamurella panacisegetis]SDP50486.1 cell envelope-related function transcriptional attenuator common domain-containing protein [Nakamurella panacisegetis]
MSITDDGPDIATAVPARRRTRRSRAVKALFAVLSAVLVLIALDAVVLSARIDHITITPTAGAPGETWVIVGSDSRAEIPDGASRATFGTTDQVAGARADIVLVVHRSPAGAVSTLSIPRDMLLRNSLRQLNRMTLTFQVSPQNLVDSLCTTLGIPTDHLVVVDFAVFTSVIDDLGGIVVDVPAPVRDAYTGLDLTTAGPQRVTGTQALALVRSRHPEQLVGGRWQLMSDGAQQRTSWGGVIFRTVEQAVAASGNPALLQGLAWTVSGAMRTDHSTSLADLAILAQYAGPVVDLPAKSVGDGFAVAASDDTYSALQAAGFDRTCR